MSVRAHTKAQSMVSVVMLTLSYSQVPRAVCAHTGWDEAQDVKGVAQTWRVLQRNAIWNPGFKEMY